jgi:sterol desaturase/sphingolipid hydroxylase (fatty acid hydroxylase superfamily)
MIELLRHMQEHPLWQYRQALLYLAFAAMLLEMFVLALRFRETYQPGLMLTTTTMWIVEQGGRLAMYPMRLAVFVLLAQLSPVPTLHGLMAFALAYVGVDFLYYWKHRMLHSFEWGWALHSVHHSTDDMNLMAAIRLGWVQRWVDDFFYLPLVLLGFDPVLVLLTVELNHASQYWCHTRCVGGLGVVDALINTPANHRVHHARERAVANHNYGSTLMCWDKWFGSYQAEPAGGVRAFGVEQSPVGLNPLRIQLAPLVDYLRGLVTPAPHRER